MQPPPPPPPTPPPHTHTHACGHCLACCPALSAYLCITASVLPLARQLALFGAPCWPLPCGLGPWSCLALVQDPTRTLPNPSTAGVDFISLSFVKSADPIRNLRSYIESRAPRRIEVIAKVGIPVSSRKRGARTG